MLKKVRSAISRQGSTALPEDASGKEIICLVRLPRCHKMNRFFFSSRGSGVRGSPICRLTVSQSLFSLISSFNSLILSSSFKLFLMCFDDFVFVLACLSGEDDHDQKREGDKENYPSPLSPTSVKRRCLDLSESCHFVLMDATVPVLSGSLEEQQVLTPL